ncbi:hypothetical protein S40288_11393 [Stachybotrys chartarum IBT 40288]|nr:hypothetical protein S40288_11393 [Stachybotrys chartarum IBT 40288]
MFRDGPRGQASPLPSFTLQTPAVDFMENRLEQYHPAFNPRHVRYDLLQAQFVAKMPPRTDELSLQGGHPSTPVPSGVIFSSPRLPRSPSGAVSEMAFWEDIFPRAMESLRNDAASERIRDPAWQIRHLSTWSDVQARLDTARQKYDFHYGPKHIGKFRRWVRGGLDKHAITLTQATRVIPEMAITKPVIGAIRLVLDAYRQVSQTREELETSFEDLPEVFEKINFYVPTFPDDTNITKASSKLFRSVLVAIESAIAFYTGHQAKRAGSAIMSGPEYAKTLLESLMDIERDCKTLESQASMSLTHRVTQDSGQMMQQNAVILEEHMRMQRVLGVMNQHVQMSSDGIMYVVHLFNRVLPLLNDFQMPCSRSSMRRSPSPPPSPQPIESQTSWSSQDIRYWLHFPDVDIQDLQHVSEQIEHLIHEDRGRTQQLLETRPFKNWMSRGGSAKLLVHGNFRPPYDVSPLSVVCTLLTHTFRTSGQGFVGLVFFCGRHLKWDEHQGSLAMIRSLIAQLLHQYSLLAIRPDPMVDLQNLELSDVNILCHVFSALVRQLPSSVSTFCIIDGISLYETEDFEDGFDVVLMSLIAMAEHGETSGWPTFKLLLTSPQPTLEVRKAFDPEPDTLVHMQGLYQSYGRIDTVGTQEILMSDHRPNES